MRRRSLTGPLILLIIGGLFLWRNLHPEAPIFDIVAQYWPFLLIGWGLLRLMEVAFWREARPSGFTGGEIVLVILVCMAGSLTWAARQNGFMFHINNGLDWWGSQFDYPVTASAPAAGMKRIVFDNPRGNIRLIGADVTEITVSGHKTIRAYSREDADRTNGNTAVDLVPQGDRLLIRTNQEHTPDRQQISDELDVTVPRSLAVEARGHNGDFDITDVAGDVELTSDKADVRLARVGGNVRLDVGRSDLIRGIDLKGRVDVQGRGSDIELENIDGQVTISGAYNGNLDFKKLAKPLQFEGARNTELNVVAVPGHINMDLSEFNGTDLVGPIRLVANSRDVRIEQFTQSLELETARGDVELHPGRLPLPSIEARAGSGRVELVLPEKASFQLDATAQRGEAVNDFGAPLRQESDGRMATIKGQVGNGPTIHITSERGSISVRKEGATSTSNEDTGAVLEKKMDKGKLEKQLKDLKESEIKLW
jgi:Putative adhesin